MPLMTANGLSIFFAHVPKTGGSSIEDYLIHRFGPLSIREQGSEKPARQRDMIQSASHLSAADLENLLPPDLNHSFAVVRDPVDRLISEYRFQSDYSRTSKLSFSTWLRIMLNCARLDSRVYENHIRPQADLIPQGAEIFHFENGLGQIIPWLDGITKTKAPDIEIAHLLKRARQPIAPSKQDIQLIQAFYAGDYARFAYAEPHLDGHRHDPLAPMRGVLAAVLAPVIVFRQRHRWLR
jgi:hypothetical protein